MSDPPKSGAPFSFGTAAPTGSASSSAGGGLFGAATPSGGGGLFSGGNTSSISTSGSGLFGTGTSSAGSGGLFGSSKLAAAPSSSPFTFPSSTTQDSAKTTTSLFSTPSKPSEPTGGLTGQTGQTGLTGQTGQTGQPGLFSSFGQPPSAATQSTTPGSGQPTSFGFANPSTTPAGNPPGNVKSSAPAAPSLFSSTATPAAAAPPPQQQPPSLFGKISSPAQSLQPTLGGTPRSGTSTPSLFGNTGSSSSGLFGAPKTSVPATQSTATSAPATGLFSSTVNTGSTGGIFGLGANTGSAGGLFSSTKPPETTKETTGVSQQPAAASSFFGNPPSAPSGGLLGQSSATVNPSPGLFSSMSKPQPTIGTSAEASKPAAQSPFNSTGGQSSLFNQSQGSIFNKAAAPAVSNTLFPSLGAGDKTASAPGNKSETVSSPAATTSAQPSLFQGAGQKSSLFPSLPSGGLGGSSATSGPGITAVTGAASSAVAPSLGTTISAAPTTSTEGATSAAPGISLGASTAPAAPTSTAPAAAEAGKPTTLGASMAGARPSPQSRLKNKSMEEIITRWASDLAKYQKEFQKQAEQVAEWDRKLVDNSDKIQKLYGSTLEAERATVEVERQLSTVENEQAELEYWLDDYERQVDEMMANQIGQGDSLQGPDQERERTYKTAEKLSDRLDEMGKDLTSIIEEINDASSNLSKNSKSDDPLSQIVRVLNGHLSQLQQIDQGTAALHLKVTEAQKASWSLSSRGGLGGLGNDAASDFYKSYMGRR